MGVLEHLLSFLADVVQHTAESKMSVGNVAAVFAPNLLRPEVETLEHLADTAHIVNLIAVLISSQHFIFHGASPDAPPAAARSSSAHYASSSELSRELSQRLSLGNAAARVSARASRASAAAQPASATDDFDRSCSALSAAHYASNYASGDAIRQSQHLQYGGSAVSIGDDDAYYAVEAVDTPEGAGLPKPWYYLDSEHQQNGPVSWSDLQGLKSQGSIDGSTYLFAEGMGDWQLAAHVDVDGPEPQ